GEMNVYEMDPIVAVNKHLRGLYMSKHFDPHVPEWNRVVKGIMAVDEREGKVMQEYLLELQGHPHASFKRVQGAVGHVYKTLTGKDIPKGFAHDVVASLVSVVSSALIPFRPALIGRNYYESLIKVSPRTGVSHYFRGLRYVVSDATRKEAFKMAMDSGAIRPGVTKLRSLHAADDVFRLKASGRTLMKYRLIRDKGFEWYQSADDWGRAIAYHAQRIRIQDHLDDYRRGRISMSEFKSRAKINTFDPLDIQIFEKAIIAGNDKKAIDHMGITLAEETMTRYGYADHPAGWNSVSGRLLGQFGTWPVQYKDYLLQGITRGSAKDRIEFATIHGAISGATVLAGASVGVNLSNWTGWGLYMGGPYADMA
ncbi:unnamed protein product, partial [marine sediment metagenome]